MLVSIEFLAILVSMLRPISNERYEILHSMVEFDF